MNSIKLKGRMHTIFTNSKNNKTSDYYRLIGTDYYSIFWIKQT